MFQGHINQTNLGHMLLHSTIKVIATRYKCGDTNSSAFNQIPSTKFNHGTVGTPKRSWFDLFGDAFPSNILGHNIVGATDETDNCKLMAALECRPTRISIPSSSWYDIA